MAFPVVQSTSIGRTTATNVSSHPISLPTGIEVGDLLVVAFAVDQIPNITVDETVSGSNWNVIPQASNGTTVTGVVLWKIAEGSDALTLITSTTEQSSHVCYRISGGYSVTGTSANGSSTNSNPPAHSGHDGLQDYLWIVTRAGDSTVVATVAPANYIGLLTQAAAGTNGASANAAQRNLAASSEDPGTFTSASEQWVSYTLAVSPVAPPEPSLISGNLSTSSSIEALLSGVGSAVGNVLSQSVVDATISSTGEPSNPTGTPFSWVGYNSLEIAAGAYVQEDTSVSAYDAYLAFCNELGRDPEVFSPIGSTDDGIAHYNLYTFLFTPPFANAMHCFTFSTEGGFGFYDTTGEINSARVNFMPTGITRGFTTQTSPYLQFILHPEGGDLMNQNTRLIHFAGGMILYSQFQHYSGNSTYLYRVALMVTPTKVVVHYENGTVSSNMVLNVITLRGADYQTANPAGEIINRYQYDFTELSGQKITYYLGEMPEPSGDMVGGSGSSTVASGTISGVANRQAASTGVSALTGLLLGVASLTCNILGTTSVIGGAIAKGNAIGSTGTASVSLGSISGAGRITGIATATSLVTGALNVQTAIGELAGNISSGATVLGSIESKGLIGVNVFGVSSISGTLNAISFRSTNIATSTATNGQLHGKGLIGSNISSNSVLNSSIRANGRLFVSLSSETIANGNITAAVNGPSAGAISISSITGNILGLGSITTSLGCAGYMLGQLIGIGSIEGINYSHLLLSGNLLGTGSIDVNTESKSTTIGYLTQQGNIQAFVDGNWVNGSMTVYLGGNWINGTIRYYKNGVWT